MGVSAAHLQLEEEEVHLGMEENIFPRGPWPDTAGEPRQCGDGERQNWEGDWYTYHYTIHDPKTIYAAANPACWRKKKGSPGGDTVEPTRADLMNAIEDIHSALEQQIEIVSIDLNAADLRKVSEKVNTAETNTWSLQGDMASLKKQMTTMHAEMEADTESRYILLRGTLDGHPLEILNAYAPNSYDPTFYPAIAS
ncbi:hypothetical protein NDU88_005787 [Pleurodeles waltl]|uniref:Uncharacterized protein n=1 Tax=Pleurodeles waltl TaxID=8319 RepID=A0AAV7PPJ7_PLEWA|nr:hypothetical protein NDU88_005787 [Pleurodeles waltl]